MKNKYEKEEIDLLKSIENGNWKKIPDMNNKIKEHIIYAKNHIKKDKRINIRISAMDLELIQRKALAEGLPYQTLISSILHKYLNAS